MQWALRLGRVAGTEVRIHLTFFLLLAWLGAEEYKRQGASAALQAVLLLCLVFFCVLLHEFGHALAARRYGIRTPDITLFPIGGVARLDRIPEKPREEIFVAVAGPLVNVAIAAGLWLALFGLHLPSPELLSRLHNTFAGTLLMVNISLVAFNLLPAFPMDGGRVLRALLAMKMGHRRATHAAARIGQFVAIGMGLAGLHYEKLMLILIAIFVFAAAASESGAVELKSATRGLSVSDAMVTKFQTLPRNACLGEAVDVLLQTSQHEFPIVDPDGTLRGIFTRNDLVTSLRISGPETLVTEVMRTDFRSVNPGTPFEDAVQMLQQDGRSVLPVTDEAGRMVGLFTTENIGELLMVRTAIAASRRDSRR